MINSPKKLGKRVKREELKWGKEREKKKRDGERWNSRRGGGKNMDILTNIHLCARLAEAEDDQELCVCAGRLCLEGRVA